MWKQSYFSLVKFFVQLLQLIKLKWPCSFSQLINYIKTFFYFINFKYFQFVKAIRCPKFNFIILHLLQFFPAKGTAWWNLSCFSHDTLLFSLGFLEAFYLPSVQFTLYKQRLNRHLRKKFVEHFEASSFRAWHMTIFNILYGPLINSQFFAQRFVIPISCLF